MEMVSTSFLDFVNRVLALQGSSPVHKFSLDIEDRYESPVDSARVFGWILSVLKRGVSDVELRSYLESECVLPSEFFLSKTLVRMKLNDAYLPKLKTLYLEDLHFENQGVGFVKLLSGCHMLEDLDLEWISWCLWDSASVSVPTLKRLRFCWEERQENPNSLSFDTPSLVNLEYTDTVAHKYPKVNFSSLVEAKIDLRMSDEQMGEAAFKEDASFFGLQIYYSKDGGENGMLGNATDFIMGICNVKILYLFANTLEVLTHCCEAIPVFNNLTHLTVESKPIVGWQSLPGLLKNSPNLETLVLQGLVHKVTDKCRVVCVCNPYEGEEEISTCLSSSPVKVLKIMKFGEISNHWNHGNHRIEKQIEQVKHFLETMPNLEQLILYYDTSIVEDVTEVSSQLLTVDKVASSKCSVQLISDNLNVPSSGTMTLP